MKLVTITPSKVNGCVNAPSSKSYAQRACAAALLKGGKTILTNYGNSNDEKIALEIIKQLGAIVTIENNIVTIESYFESTDKQIKKIDLFVEESGLSLRLFTPIAAILNLPISITGSGSLVTRPIDLFVDVLPQLQVFIKTNKGKLPMQILGSLQIDNITIDGNVSSQFLTGFMFAYSYLSKKLAINKKVSIVVNNLNSKPYIDVSLDVLKAFDLPTPINTNYKEFIFNRKYILPTNNKSIQYNIEGDWSNTAFLLVAGAIAGKIAVKNINIKSLQADKKIVEVLRNCGATILLNNDEICITQPHKFLNYFDIDATDCPDLFPPLVALAANCKGVSTIKGVNRLQHKESNRALTLQNEFRKLGVTIHIKEDTMYITGTKNIIGAIVSSNNDHRIVMACAIAALNANANVVIEAADAINKSYPNFYNDLKMLGVGIK